MGKRGGGLSQPQCPSCPHWTPVIQSLIQKGSFCHLRVGGSIVGHRLARPIWRLCLVLCRDMEHQSIGLDREHPQMASQPGIAHGQP